MSLPGKISETVSAESSKKDKDAYRTQILDNLNRWARKPVLQEIYRDFYRLIAKQVRHDLEGRIVELGSGIGEIKEVIPSCHRTDLFSLSWLDGVENAYDLSFDDGEVSNLILFDVFHTFRYPGTAIAEIARVVQPGGRLIVFEPYFSLLGFIVYGLLHHEPTGLRERITWEAPEGFSHEDDPYFVASGNAMRVFCRGEFSNRMSSWNRVSLFRIPGISYVLSGGFSRPQLYPDRLCRLMKTVDHICDNVSLISATRMLVVLEKRESSADLASLSGQES